MKVYLDTHVAVWLAQAKNSFLKQAAQEMLVSHAAAISPMVLLELSLMEEIGRVDSADALVRLLQSSIGLTICDLPFTAVIDASCRQTWTRDPFDRIITGHAAVHNAPLITKDRHIRKHYSHAIW